ncbi:MAG: hypothetical protein U0Q07_01665 [Acidimicrobiales bacterium]
MSDRPTAEAQQLLAQAEHLVLQMRAASEAEAKASTELDAVLHRLDDLHRATGERLQLTDTFVSERIGLSRPAVAKRRSRPAQAFVVTP